MAQIRSGLATALGTINDVQVSPYMLGNPTPPVIVVSRGPVSYDQAMRRGLDDVTMTVTAYVALTTDQGAQKKLDALAAPSGSGSVKAALEADRTLGGVVDDIHVTEATEERVYTAGGTQLLGTEWTVRVLST